MIGRTMLRLTTSVAAMGLAFQPIGAAQPAGAPITLQVEAGTRGPAISRDIFGQFAEHLGTRHLRRHLGRPGLADPEHARHPQRRRRGAARRIKVPERALAGRLLRRRVSLAQRHRPARAAASHAQPQLGRRDRAEQLRHRRIHGLRRADRRRRLRLGQRRLRHAAGSRRLARVHDRRPADRRWRRSAPPTATRRPTRSSISASATKAGAAAATCRPSITSSEMKRYARFTRNYNPAQQAAAERDEAHRGRPGRRQHRLHRSRDEGLEGQGAGAGTSRASRCTATPSPTAGRRTCRASASARTNTPRSCKATLKMDGLIAKHVGDHGQVRSREEGRAGRRRVGRLADANCRARNPGFLQQQNTLRDAIVAALNLNIFARHADRVRMANIAQMINVLQAMILTDGPKMVLTPTYHVYQMYVPFQDATFVPVTLRRRDLRTATSACPRSMRSRRATRRAGCGWRWSMSIRTRPASVRTSFAGMSPRGATGEVLTAATVDAHNSFDQPGAVVPRPFAGRASGGQLSFDLPPKSVAVVEVR